MIKRPILLALLSFVLGEVIAVSGGKILWVIPILFGMLMIRTITKMQAGIFVVVFLFVMIGFLISDNAVKQREFIYAQNDRPVIVTGKIANIEKTNFGWNLLLEQSQIEMNSQEKYSKLKTIHKAGKIILMCNDISGVKLGNSIRGTGKISRFLPAQNKGNFDAKKYYMSLGIYGKIENPKFVIEGKHYDRVRHMLFEFRKKLSSLLYEMTEKTENPLHHIERNKGALYAAILLGEKSELNPEIKELYSAVGIAHILAISGLHISLIGMFVYGCMRRKFCFGVSASLSILLVCVFGVMSGLGIATVRAMIMFALRLLSELFGRHYDDITAISLAGLLILLNNPFAIYHMGFQMSFTAIIAITVIYPQVRYSLQKRDEKKDDWERENLRGRKKWYKIFKDRKEKMAQIMLFSVTVSICMNPVIAYYYFQLPTYSFLVNMIVVPLMNLVVFSGIAAGGVCLWSPMLGTILILPGCVVLECYTLLCKAVERLPYSNIIVGKPSVFLVVIYYIVLGVGIWLVCLSKKKYEIRQKAKEGIIESGGRILTGKTKTSKKEKGYYRVYKMIVIIILISVTVILYVPRHREFQTTFLSVGQGDGIFVRTDNGVNIFVDGGSTSVKQVGKYRIIPFLKSEGVKKIEYAVVTHTDADHISGLQEMIEQSDAGGIRIENLILPLVNAKNVREKSKAYGELIRKAQQKEIKVILFSKGDGIKSGTVTVRCIHPSSDTQADNINDYSIVLHIAYGPFSMLLTGDISSVQETYLTDEKHGYTLLKVAHHGSKYSTSEEFLNRIKPTYSIISVGEHNLYGHPSSQVLERLKKRGIKVLRTDENGGITVFVRKGKIIIEKTVYEAE